MRIYDFSVPRPDGTELSLSNFKGKVMLIVNTATGCGFTSHYKDLEAIYEAFHEHGLEIIDIPCNQFAGQAPGTDEEIQQFCTLKYHTRFPQMKKSDVNGAYALPLFEYLKSCQGFRGFGKSPAALALSAMMLKTDKNYMDNPDIKWNFTKFVVDRQGNVVARFEPSVSMNKVRDYIEKLVQG